LELTIRLLFSLFGVNAIYATAGSKFRLIQRFVAITWFWRCLLIIPLADQNTRYIVVSGARQKNEDWDPEENGGYAVHGKPPISPLRICFLTSLVSRH
jgi:hypothetical protein